jgi:hypothetical protein
MLLDRGCFEDQPQKRGARRGNSEARMTASSFLRLVFDTAAVRCLFDVAH